jgi:serine/threonine-protein kinase
MPSFEIPDGPTTVALMSQSVGGKPVRTATVTFTVTNKAGETLSCRLKAAPQADAQAAWLQLQGEKERPFAASETQKVSVSVAVPADVKPGDFKFRLQAMNVNDPGNDYAESAVVTLTVAAPPPKPASVLPYVLIAAALVAVVGGVGAWMLLRTSSPSAPSAASAMVPNVSGIGLNFTQAQGRLLVQHFTATRVAGDATGAAPETVMSQDPPANTAVPPPTAAAPMEVKLTVDPGLAVPTNLVGQNLTSVGDQLAPFATTVQPLADDGPPGVIAALSPALGVIAKGGPLTVIVHSPSCAHVTDLTGRADLCWRVAIPVGQYDALRSNNFLTGRAP